MKTPQGEVEVHPGEYAFAPRDQAIAPRLLARPPGFWKRRALKIENRIQQRKDSLRQRIQHHLGEEVSGVGENPGELKQEIKSHRDAVKQRIEQRRPRERRNPQ
jgi:hypothetical protein